MPHATTPTTSPMPAALAAPGGTTESVAKRETEPTAGESPAFPGYHDTKEAHLRRLRRIEGQIRGLHRMVDEEKYCIDVLTQVSAATSALESFALALLEEHLAHCVSDAIAKGGTEADAKIKEASAAITRLVRS